MNLLKMISCLFIAATIFAFSNISFAGKNNDQVITDEVKSRLNQEADIPAGSIEVLTQNGIVSLKGTVDTNLQAHKAVEIASSIDKVIDVVDTQLHTKDSKSFLGDAVITAKVKGKIRHLYTSGKIGDQYELHVETTNGVVHIMGSVARKIDIDTIVNAAQSVKDVKTVKHNIKVE
jgi:hyperosmotically inducible protein